MQAVILAAEMGKCIYKRDKGIKYCKKRNR